MSLTTLPSITMSTVSYYTVSTSPLPAAGEAMTMSTNTLFVPKFDSNDAIDTTMMMNDVVCFVGKAEQLPDTNVLSAYGSVGGPNCTNPNGCGVHVHAGFDCTNTTTQEGHWYNKDTLTEDPWAFIGYLETTADGVGTYASCVHTGYDLVADPTLLTGRAFIVHAEDGSRISCGIIEESTTTMPTVLTTETVPIPGSTSPARTEGDDSGVSSSVRVLADVQSSVPDGVCYQGYAIGLEADVESFLLGTGSETCNVTNGCGVHIHSGTGCENSEVQGGHYYDKEGVAADPWLLASYLTTDSSGNTAFVGCVINGAGATEFGGKPFIVHNTDGSRLSCGLLPEGEDPAAPTAAPSGASGKSTLFLHVGAMIAAVLFVITV